GPLRQRPAVRDDRQHAVRVRKEVTRRAGGLHPPVCRTTGGFTPPARWRIYDLLRGTNVPATASPERVRQAREQLDQHVREIVTWHFSPTTGTPFWLDKTKEFRFDPLKEVKDFDDLKKFGLFEDE